MSAPRLSRFTVQQPNLVNVLSGFTFENDTRLNSTQIQALSGLLFSNGTPIVSLQDRGLLYEIINLINQKGFDQTYAYLSNTQFKTKDSVIFESPLLEKQRTQIYADMDNYRNRPITAEGAYTCGRCGSKETIAAEKQTRSADEPMTVIVSCTACPNKWKVQ